MLIWPTVGAGAGGNGELSNFDFFQFELRKSIPQISENVKFVEKCLKNANFRNRFIVLEKVGSTELYCIEVARFKILSLPCVLS